MEAGKLSTDRRVILSTIWIFYLFNILYADVLNIMGEAPVTDGAELIETLLSPEILLVAAVFLETAMVMIILSRILKYGVNRWANIIVAILHTMGVTASMFVGTPTIYYIFFAGVEITTSLFIVWYAWTWAKPQG